ncbi:MAG: MBL fold metallo-hydrolase [Lachnospiraceae bacterium]|nr:MBL fold metallo-hydrolase [Lachnospiraceae bacterium]
MQKEIQQMIVGPIQTNCYILSDPKTKEAIVIDPGAEADRIAREIRKKGLSVIAYLLTHAHWDHIDGLSDLKSEFPAPVYISEKEKETLENPAINMSLPLGGQEKTYQADIFLKDGEDVTLKSFYFRCISTPGHTPGGACYYFPQEKILFSGDSLFCGSIGRTDGVKGSMADLVRALREKVLILPEQTLVLPGHGPETDIRQEEASNMYLM